MPTRRTIATALTATIALVAATEAGAAVNLGGKRITITAPDGSRTVVSRSPFRISFEDARGNRVLAALSAGNERPVTRPPTPRSQFSAFGPAPPTNYSPLGFFVGSRDVAQSPGGQWAATLQSVTVDGPGYGVRRLLSASRSGRGVELELSTSDPSGRTVVVDIAPAKGSTFQIRARPRPSAGVATTFASFVAGAGEALYGFGGRHNAIDQRGNEFYNYLQQQNISSGSLEGLTPVPPGGPSYLFPNGPHAAYYVQSQFISSAGYGFALDRDEISDWRLASDRPDAWQVESFAATIAYRVAPGKPAEAIADLTAIGGRHRVPPRWAVGTMYDRLVLFPPESAAQYLSEIEQDLADFDRYNLPPDGYRIEGWEFLSDAQLARVISELRRRGIHPMLYFRLFVGEDEIGTDDPSLFDLAVDRGYVATQGDGTPYTFVSNFSAQAAMIDFTDPEAVAWWKARITRALELGADGFMQDFGEQVFEDMHFADGSTGRTMHNRLPTLAHRATAQAVRAFEREHPERAGVFYFTRAGYSGSPGAARYEYANFPGDETTDWSRSSGIASLTSDMLSRAVGGAYGYTTDIGGYFDVGPYEATTKELFSRWAEWAALSPMFRLHGSVLNGVHAPWTYDADTVALYRRLSRLHLRARPLILRLWERARRTGTPITRPLWLAYPNDPPAARQDQEWLLGPKVLVAPVVDEGATSRKVYFPRGCWRSPESGLRVRGPAARTVAAPLERLPYFFRCGSEPFHPPGD